MSGLNKVVNRFSQFTLSKGQMVMHYGVPDIIHGPGSIVQLPRRIKSDGIERVMIVAGKTVLKYGLLDNLIDAVNEEHIKYVIFDGAEPNPTIDNVEDGVRLYNEHNCQGIVAVGGGSSMDCAKIIGARIGNPKKSVEQMGGILKVKHRIPPFYAVPTTAGTGSEATIAAVIVNSTDRHKYSVSDPKLLPKIAVLDPELTVSLPSSVTAETGMDALTHAIEAYTNMYGSRFAYSNAKKAVKLIFDNLAEACSNGNNMEARRNMLLASYYAGVAFTRNCVGNVHAAGHPLSGLYNLPHGRVMAVLLPVVLKKYGENVYKPLSELGTLVGLKGNSRKSVALKFIKRIEKMNSEMGIPDFFNEIKKEDLDKMASFAVAESNKVYPTPEIWDDKEFKAVYYSLSSSV